MSLGSVERRGTETRRGGGGGGSQEGGRRILAIAGY